MIHVQQVIIVEGKYDKIKLSSVVDGMILVTNGFSIFKDKEKMSLIRTYAEKTGIIILTDSDSAGFKIRNYLKGAVKGNIINVYIPDIFGKERRKEKASKEGKLGVEGMNNEIIVDAFKKAGVVFSERDTQKEKITRIHLYEDGFSGGENSSFKRKKLLEYLELPELLSVSGMLDVLNSMFSLDEYKKIISEFDSEKGE